MSIFQYFVPGRTLFGYGCLAGIGPEIQANGYKKALIVTDPSLVELGIVKKVTDVLEEYSINFALYSGVKPNPDLGDVEKGLALVKEESCDFLISVGGGSAHDCAKAVGIVAANGGSVLDYRGVDKSSRPSLPVVAVNTTAGTASECTRAYVIVNEETSEKFGIKDRHALPVLAVDDHSLMMDLPKGLTAGTGMDALTHAIEAYTSVNGFLLTCSLALEAVRLIFKHLEVAVLCPDQASREGMAAGQYLAGLAFGNAGCGLVHSMSHQLSAVYGLPHGLCNGILLPEVMRFNCGSDKARQQYGEIGEAIFPLECHGKTEEEKAEILIRQVENLSEKVGTRVPLKEIGVKKEDLGLLARKALQDGSLGNNRVLPSAEQVERIYDVLMERREEG